MEQANTAPAAKVARYDHHGGDHLQQRHFTGSLDQHGRPDHAQRPSFTLKLVPGGQGGGAPPRGGGLVVCLFRRAGDGEGRGDVLDYGGHLNERRGGHARFEYLRAGDIYTVVSHLPGRF